MAFDAYIQIAGITGEALDEQYANWIEIIGYKFGPTRAPLPPLAPRVVHHQVAQPLPTSPSPSTLTVPAASCWRRAVPGST